MSRIPKPQWPTHSFRAMGSQMAFWLDAPAGVTRSLFAQAEAMFASAERALSRFDPDSELSRLNARPGQWQPLSPILWQVLEQATMMTKATGGLFDPTILGDLEAAGYDRSFDQLRRLPDADRQPLPAPGAPPRPRPEPWALDPQRRALWLPVGTRLDLGGIAKGFTAQRAANLLAEAGPCLVDAGGDLTAGAAPVGFPGWPVAVAAPGRDDAADLFHLWLANASLATSGVDYRRWQHNGCPAHHLIDPRTGCPAGTDLLSVTVLAPAGSLAEGWATAALVAGREQGFALLQRAGLAGALVGQDGRAWLTAVMKPQVLWPSPIAYRSLDFGQAAYL